MAVFTLGNDITLCLLCANIFTSISYWPYSGVVIVLILVVLIQGIVG